MKKILFLMAVLGLACSCAWADTLISAEVFPDPNFRRIVAAFDTNTDGTLQASEISAVTAIRASSSDIASLEGIRTFTSLKSLQCHRNNITSLNLRGLTQLEYLSCGHNPLVSLDLTGCVGLRTIFCTNTKLQSLGLSYAAHLRELYCYVSSLDVLDVSANTALVSLDCQENNLRTIDLTHNPAIEYLDVSGNSITSLNLSGNPNIKALICRDLNLANGLDLSAQKDLISLWCWNSGLTSLVLSSQCSLAELICRDNPLTGNVDLNTIAEYSQIWHRIMEKDNVTILTALDSEGNKVQSDGSVSPALVKYTYNTGLANVKLTVTALTPSAQGFASCSNGIFEGVIDGNMAVWKGIPYAKQPVGSLRWKAPEAPDDSSEVYEAFEFAHVPLQHESLHNPSRIMPRGEDCLALNVWNQSPDISSPKPVMVWVHGGSFNSGGTSNPEYNGENFIRAHNDVVFVSIGYRVGIMGFIDFANSGLPGGENYPDSGNLSLLDIIEALRWIKSNIIAFGGDPENITVFGQSSGSASVALVMTMPQTAGLFRRAILQSGAVNMTQSIEDSAALTQELVRLTGAQSMDDLLALSSEELLALTEQLQGATNFPERDGVNISDNPYEAFARNSVNFEVLAGTMADEVDYWKLAVGPAFSQILAGAFWQMAQGIAQYSSDDARIPEQFIAMYIEQNDGADESEAITAFFNDLLFRVPTLAELENFAGRKYAYYWKKGSGVSGIGACHALDLPYVLNTPNRLLQFIVDDDLAGKVQDMWRGFAKSGVPSEAWTAYDTTTRATMIIDEEPSISYGHLAERYALMTPLLKYGFSGRELINAIAGQNTGGDDGDGDGDEPTDNGDTGSNGGNGNSGGDDTTGNNDTGNGDTPSNGNENAPTTNDPGSSGGGCSSGFGVWALCALGCLAFRKKQA